MLFFKFSEYILRREKLKQILAGTSSKFVFHMFQVKSHELQVAHMPTFISAC